MRHCWLHMPLSPQHWPHDVIDFAFDIFHTIIIIFHYRWSFRWLITPFFITPDTTPLRHTPFIEYWPILAATAITVTPPLSSWLRCCCHNIGCWLSPCWLRHWCHYAIAINIAAISLGYIKITLIAFFMMPWYTLLRWVATLFQRIPQDWSPDATHCCHYTLIRHWYRLPSPLLRHFRHTDIFIVFNIIIALRHTITMPILRLPPFSFDITSIANIDTTMHTPCCHYAIITLSLLIHIAGFAIIVLRFHTLHYRHLLSLLICCHTIIFAILAISFILAPLLFTLLLLHYWLLLLLIFCHNVISWHAA